MQNTATITRRVDELGRVVLPAEYRNAMGIGKETPVSMTYSNGSIIINLSVPTCKICYSQEDIDPELKVCSACIKKIRETE